MQIRSVSVCRSEAYLYADQKVVAPVFRNSGAHVVFDDDSIVQKLTSYLTAKGWESEEAGFQGFLIAHVGTTAMSKTCASCQQSLLDAYQMVCKTCLSIGCSSFVLDWILLGLLGHGRNTSRDSSAF